MCRCLVLSTACLLLLIAPLNTVQADLVFFDLQGKAGVGLLAGNENHTPSGTPGSGGEFGTGIFFDDVSNVLTINARWGSVNGFTDLTGDVTGAHVHGPTLDGGVGSFTQNAGVKFNIGGTATGFNSSASAGGWTNTQISLTSAQDILDLFAGKFYLNVHTGTNGNGEIRGNLVAVPEPSSIGLMVLLGIPAFLTRRRARQTLQNS